MTRLYLAESKTVAVIQTVGGRLGYLDASIEGQAQWVWLDADAISRLRPYSGPPVVGVMRQPDLQMGRD